MSKAIPEIQRYMTTAPYSVGIDQPLSTAHALMRTHLLRHLPVLAGGKLAGVITDRDLHLIETLRDVDPEKVTIEEAMSTSVYTVAPSTPLDEIAAEMAEHKYGCAIVVDHAKVVGVFTTTDACRALTETLRKRQHA